MLGRIAAFATVLLFAAVLAAQQAPPASARLEDLRWLAGCRGGEMGNGSRFEECWNMPRGGAMQGSARITRDGRTTFREFILLEQEGEHVIMTVQHVGPRLAPQGKPVSFTLVRLAENEAVFENPQHDHPQRISYRRAEDGNITARIDNLDGSRAAEFPMHRPR